MKIQTTPFRDLFIIEPEIFQDSRGYFFESFNNREFNQKSGLDINFLQDNQSFSSFGVLRGLHYQKDKYSQAKLVRVLQGVVMDVVIDLRPNQSTFGQHFSIELSGENKKQLFVPRGFAHGFVVKSSTAEFFYKCDNYYHSESEMGILYNDPSLKIDWEVPSDKLKISKKDAENKSFEEIIDTL